ncbi:DPP IV N-terminal domain-containing protein [Filimonas effusa]|uniref:S9 family peptidase n=1 Tax=Filimonas effusa TaxID=2508721 RepID=A0A4Q1DEF4_9BACT|nr:DPP IV N-terminal domain-containing protein [Filimonas effusa]RXK87073.1 S9 family peptidase [Filimonas effusa]
MRNRWLIAGLTLITCYATAQKPAFDEAEKYDALQLQKLTGSLTPVPFFSADGKSFTFTVEAPVSKARQVYRVTPSAKTKEPAKDTPSSLPKTFKFYGTDTSPDRQWQLYAQDHNLYLKHEADSTGKALTSNGSLFNSYSSVAETNMNGHTPTNACWSKDSRYFCLIRKDNRRVPTMSVISSTSFGRPYLNTYKYEMPGDSIVAQYELYIGSIDADTLRKINIAKWPDQEVQITGSKLPEKEIYIIRRKRTRDEMELCAVNLETGVLRVVIHETSKPFINEDMFHEYIVNEGKDIIWWSDRSGWGHYYHYNSEGKLLNAITTGDWTAGKLAGIDTLKKCIYVYGYGREKGVNPYYAYLYKVNFDGTGFTLLTPETATHGVFLSPNREYFIDHFSTINQGPKTIVRSTSGKFIMEAYQPDLTALYASGWQAPEPFVVKAADGITDLYGLMWKPFHFDSTRKYPIISQVYPGPQIETVWTEFTVTDRYNNTALAQVGFIVVCMGHRGNSPIRNAAYYKYGYGNLRDNALEDDKYGLEQLARRFSFIDSTRVGIFGHSGGGMMTVAAMGTYPDFYKAGVASSGNHDNTIYNRTWGESYQGFSKPFAKNQALAKNITGPLLLVAGEADANVNPAHTMRMSDALIQAGKDFDLLILPGQSHTYEGVYKRYYEHRLRKFFAAHLLK